MQAPRNRPSRPRLLRMAATGVGLACVAACALATAPHAAADLIRVNFSPTGAIQTWQVPAGVQSVSVAMAGGAGGGYNGVPYFTNASTATATLTIPNGVSALDVVVGLPGQVAVQAPSGAGGWPNGGNGGYNGYWYAGGGGGSSDIRPSGAPFTSALIVSGGSGGTGGYATPNNGGLGGFGAVNSAGAGQPGEGTDGGAGGAPAALPTGTNGQGGNGASDSDNDHSGAGGGGGGGWRPGAGGGAGTAWILSFLTGGGGGGGGGAGSAVAQYVTGINSYMGTASSFVQLSYLAVTSTQPATPPAVGSPTSWRYSAGTGATYAVTSGSLPPGVTLDGNSGQVWGVPTKAGTFTFTVKASVYPDGTNAVSTTTPTTITVNTGGPADLVATSASAVGTTTATLNGSVVAGKAPVTNLTCAYSTTNPGKQAIPPPGWPATPATVAPTPTGAATAVSCPAIWGLASNQKYYFQVQGQQLGALVKSNTATFTTGSAPVSVAALGVTKVGQTSATANGWISATQNVASIYCRVSTTVGGVRQAPRIAATPPSTKGVVESKFITCPLTGLAPNTVYHFAVFARDASGTSMSPTIRSFTTRVAPPRVGTISATAVTSTTAVIRGTVIPTNEAVSSVGCRYTTSPGNPARGTQVAASPFTMAQTPVQRAATCNLTGLTPSTTYLARMEATDQAGTAAGPNVVTFTTAAAGQGGSTPSPGGATGQPKVAITSARAVGGRLIQMRVRANQRGTIRVAGSYAIASTGVRKPACSARVVVSRAGTFTATCPFTAATRAALAARSLRMGLRATLTTASKQAATATRTILVPRSTPGAPPVTG